MPPFATHLPRKLASFRVKALVQCPQLQPELQLLPGLPGLGVIASTPCLPTTCILRPITSPPLLPTCATRHQRPIPCRCATLTCSVSLPAARSLLPWGSTALQAHRTSQACRGYTSHIGYTSPSLRREAFRHTCKNTDISLLSTARRCSPPLHPNLPDTYSHATGAPADAPSQTPPLHKHHADTYLAHSQTPRSTAPPRGVPFHHNVWMRLRRLP
jgi:hypothetical protein